MGATVEAPRLFSPPRAAAAAAGQLASAAARPVDGGAGGSGLPVLPPPLLPVGWPLLPVSRWTVARGGAARVFSPSRCRRAAAGRLASAAGRPVDCGAGGSGTCLLPPVLPPLLPASSPLLPVGRWTVALGGVACVFSPPRAAAAGKGEPRQARATGGRRPPRLAAGDGPRRTVGQARGGSRLEREVVRGGCMLVWCMAHGGLVKIGERGL